MAERRRGLRQANSSTAPGEELEFSVRYESGRIRLTHPTIETLHELLRIARGRGARSVIPQTDPPHTVSGINTPDLWNIVRQIERIVKDRATRGETKTVFKFVTI